jgi:hypothetical protein
MSKMKRCLIVFAKEPQKGRIKTRLAASIGEEEALCLYKAFLKDTLIIARCAETDNKILAYDSCSKEPEYLKMISDNFLFYEQKGKDLGEKMSNAFGYAHENGADHIVIIGSDSPTLPASCLDEAFQLLEEYDVVIGPSQDGGFYLVGSKVPARGMFNDVKWGSDKALEQTLENIISLQKRFVLMDPWYDVDTQDDLKSLKDKLQEDEGLKALFTKQVLKIR